jgi:hypothetical protein
MTGKPGLYRAESDAGALGDCPVFSGEGQTAVQARDTIRILGGFGHVPRCG